MKRIIYQTILVAVGCSLLAFSQARREATPQGQVTFKVESKLVVIDAVVRDKKGNLIDSLKQKDFRIYEDNIAQEIVTFSLEDIPADAPETPAEPAPETPRAATVNFSVTPRAEVKKEVLKDKRLIIMLFDLSSLKTEELIRSVTTAEEFVQKKSTAHDLLAIATYSSELQLLQDLTNDKETLIKVLRQINPDEAGDAAVEELGEADSEAFVPDDVQFNIFNTDRRLSALETLAKTYREFQERKSLIYFSSGMTTTGIENQSQIRYTVDMANQSNLSIYTVDSRGLEALPPGGGASRGSPGGRGLFSGDALTRQTASLSGSQETLTTLARDTGGAAFQDTNELAPVFDKVRNDTKTYYILGYYSSNTKEDGKFRKVRLEVSVPDLKLQHRPGYFASKHFTRLTQSERDRQLEEALKLERPFSELPFILEADYFKGNEKNNVVPISLQLAGDAVQFEEKGDRRQAQFEFLAQLTDPKGKVAGIARDTVEVRLPISRAEKIKSGQIMYSTGFQLQPGEYHLKFLVRDNLTGKLGSFEQPLSVPSLEGKNLQISSVVLGSRLVKPESNSSDVRHRGLGERFRALGVRRDPLMIEDKKIVPSIGHVFLSRQTLHVYFQVYGAAADRQTGKPSVESRLLFLKDKTKVRESEPHLVQQWTTDDKNVTVAMTLPLKGLQRGTYALQLHVRDNTSDTNLFQRVPLVIN